MWYHPQLKPSPEGVQLYASPILYLLFFLVCGILELCIGSRTKLEYTQHSLDRGEHHHSCFTHRVEQFA